MKVWLERFRRNLTSVDVDGQEVNGVVLGVEWVFRVFAVVGHSMVLTFRVHYIRIKSLLFWDGTPFRDFFAA